MRDNGGIARQIGTTPEALARRQIEEEGGPEHAAPAFTPLMDEVGPYAGTGNDDEWGERHADLMGRLMSADLAAIGRTYDRGVTLELPGDRQADGTGAADRFWVALRSAFPDADFAVHHRMGRDDPLHPPRSAVRWSLWGRHEGWGAFGRPTGARVYVMGISHAEWGPRGLRREWISYDELAIWRQIHAHTG